MALIYQAQLTPTKLELLSAWVPSQPWFRTAVDGADDSADDGAEGPSSVGTELKAVGAYRFDDPAGEVGIETHLLQASTPGQTGAGRVLQVPLTYRNEPLDGAESALLGTMQHSVLGERWVYDGCADPVYVTALATAILGGGTEAVHEVVSDGANVLRPTTTKVFGSGSSGTEVPALGSLTLASQTGITLVTTDQLILEVARVIGAFGLAHSSGDAQTLNGTWPGHDVPALLALARQP